jgi:hypothetical protein
MFKILYFKKLDNEIINEFNYIHLAQRVVVTHNTIYLLAYP